MYQGSDGEYWDLSWQCYNLYKNACQKDVIVSPGHVSQSTQIPFKELGYHFFKELIWL